jgi:hypothetical protein
MEVCINKKTGRFFIYLEEDENGRALMVTPNGDVKKLEHALFTDPFDIDDIDRLHSRNQISNKQYDVYQQYKGN